MQAKNESLRGENNITYNSLWKDASSYATAEVQQLLTLM